MHQHIFRSTKMIATTSAIAAAVAYTIYAAPPATPTPATSHADLHITTIPPHTQSTGDPDAGYHYLLHGDYIGSGIPLDIFSKLPGALSDSTNIIQRQGIAGKISHTLNAFNMHSGNTVVAGLNCLACHSTQFNGQLIVGLGETTSDYSGNSAFNSNQIRALALTAFRPGSSKWTDMQQFLRGVDVLNNRLTTPFRGPIPAFSMEEIAAAHRIPETLAWSEDPLFPVPNRTIASDVPPWWHLKKKHALYYTAGGRGDFTKLIQQINVVGIKDKQDAARINNSMQDLLAYIRTIEPPAYPYPIDETRAAQGQLIYASNCADCHGTYHPTNPALDTYPNKLIPVGTVGTDPGYAQIMHDTNLDEWFNTSWYATSQPTAYAEPSLAYIAPPLDGIWITAPYLHNGSIPTLEALLDSSKRPTYWKRTFTNDDAEYDQSAVGWRYTTIDPAMRESVEASKTQISKTQLDSDTYNTTIPNFGNQGHTFGDHLSNEDRRALIEYLKTL